MTDLEGTIRVLDFCETEWQGESKTVHLPGSFVSIRRHYDALITQEVTEGMSVALTSGSVKMENNWDLLTGRSGRDGNLGSPDMQPIYW